MTKFRYEDQKDIKIHRNLVNFQSKQINQLLVKYKPYLTSHMLI